MSKDQGQVVEGDDTHGQPETSQTIEIDGQQVDLEELKAGYMRHSDYTKKTMELAEERKKISSSSETSLDDSEVLSKDVDKLVDILAPKLQERFISRQESDLEKFLQANPDLESKRKLLEDLGKGNAKSYWDIAAEYSLKETDALEKSKSRKIVGTSRTEPKPVKKISDLTPEEYAQWRKDNLGKREQWTTATMV